MSSAQTVTATFSTTPPKPVRCVVPRVKGKTLGAARKAIGSAHCTATVVAAYSSQVRKGVVISQRPAPGTRLRKGARVALVVSKGKRPRRR
jgi:serine/threonine-protein kinase